MWYILPSYIILFLNYFKYNFKIKIKKGLKSPNNECCELYSIEAYNRRTRYIL